MHPSIKGLLDFFEYDHLPTTLHGIAKPFGDTARLMVEELEATKHPQELTVCLRKLLEAKDAGVRAGLSCRNTSRRYD